MTGKMCPSTHRDYKHSCIRKCSHEGLCHSKWLVGPSGRLVQIRWYSENGEYKSHVGYKEMTKPINSTK